MVQDNVTKTLKERIERKDKLINEMQKQSEDTDKANKKIAFMKESISKLKENEEKVL